MPELCNGLDDDLDGLIDAWPDGGPLTMACPLTLGVCAGARSFCVDGGWAACDYGPDYQLTERRCDGLDNDCDGTVDSSWTRTVLDADAGRFGALMEGDVQIVQVVPGTSGHWLSLPNDLLVVDDDLTLVSRTRFPVLHNGYAFVFPNGAEWLRIAEDYPVSGPPTGVLFHRVFADGGFPEASDGGVELVAEHRWSGGCRGRSLRVIARDGGWTAAQGFFPAGAACPTGALLRLVQDGGLTVQLLDGGKPVQSGLGAEVVTDDRGFALSMNGETWAVDADRGVLQPWFTAPLGCFLATLDPVAASCWSTVSTWVDPLTSRPFAPGQWFPVSYLGVPGRALAVGPPSNWDAGFPWPATRLVEVRDGGIAAVMPLEGAPTYYQVGVQPIAGPLHLVTWADEHLSGVCPACPIRRLAARYTCLPP